MLNWVFGNKRKGKGKSPARRKKAKGVKPAYEKAREIAATGSVEERAGLAQHEDLEPEILYYFASDKAPEVRREVAENPGTPLQADLILAEDTDEEVRCELAGKIGRLIPDLAADENERLAEMAMQIVQVLARDELPRVRAVIAEELKNTPNVPKEMMLNLAADLEDTVAVPVLEYSPLLDPTDLVRLVENGLRQEALNAVARRKELAAPVTEAVVKTENEEAVGAMLENETANISEAAFEGIAVEAQEKPVLQPPLVDREDLPMRTILRVASFVSAGLMESLTARHGHHPEIVDQLRKTVRDRIERGDLPSDEPDAGELAEDRARIMHQKGELTDEVIDEFLDDNDLVFIRHALGMMAGVPDEQLVTIIRANSPKAMTALCWKAGLRMRTAVRVQTQLGRIRFDRVLEPKSDGGYPLSQEDLDFYLESFFDGGSDDSPLRGVRATH